MRVIRRKTEGTNTWHVVQDGQSGKLSNEQGFGVGENRPCVGHVFSSFSAQAVKLDERWSFEDVRVFVQHFEENLQKGEIKSNIKFRVNNT